MGYREFRRAELPRAQDYQDETILVIETDGSRTLLFSDGATWQANGGGGVAISIGTQLFTSGTVNFSNSNGVTFGADTAGIGTASVAGTVAGGTANINLSAGTTSSARSAFTFSNANGVSFGLNTTGVVTGSVAAQTNQSLGLYAVSNTTQGTSGTVDARTLSAAGAGNVSVGVSNGSLVVSGSQSTAPGAIIAAGGTVTSGSLSFSNGSGVSFGIAGQTLTGSVAAQTNQQAGLYAVSNTTQSTSGTADARSLSFGGAGAASVGVTGGSVVVSAPVQTNQTVGAYAMNNTTQASSGTIDARSLSVLGAGIVSVGVSNGSLVISATAAAGTGADGGNVLAAGTRTALSTATVLFSNLNGVTFGLDTTNGSIMTASVAAQTNQSIGIYGSSQTTGQSSSSTVDARSISIVGAGGVSVGLSGGSFIVSGGAGGGAMGLSAGTQSVSTGTPVLSNSNGITFGMSGSSRVTASFALSNQVISAFAVSNTTQSSSGTINVSAVSLAGAGAVSVGVSNGSIVVSAAAGAQSNQAIGFYASSQTTGQSSSSTVDARSISIVGAGLISAGMSGGSLIISAPDTTSYNPLSVGFSTNGNTAGDTGFGTDRVVFAGGANITLSGSTNAGSMTISIAGGAGAAFGVSAGTQSVNTGTMVFSNSNGLTFGMSGSSRITMSMALSNQVVSAFAVSNTTQSSSQTVNVSAFSFAGAGNVSVGASNGSIVVSGQTQSNQVLSAYAVSNTTQSTSGTINASVLSINGAGAVSVGVSNGSIIVSAAAGAQSVQTLGLYGSSQTTGQSSSSTVDARSFSIVGAGGVSVGLSGGSFIVSGGAGGGALSAGLSNVGNTSGNTGVVTGQLVLAGGNNVTLSGSTNAGSMTVTVSAASQTNQSVGLYALGNTTQNSSTTLDARTVSFNGLGAMTVGFSNGSVQLSAPATSSLSATGAVSIVVNGATISIGAPGGTLSRFEWPPTQCGQISSSQQTNSVYSFRPVSVMEPISFSRVDIPVLVGLASAATSNTAAIALSAMMVLYTRNGVTFSPIVGASASSTFSWASNSSNYSGISGGHPLSFGLASMLTPGEYYAGFYISTASAISTGAATTALNATMSVLALSNFTATAFAEFGSMWSNSSNRDIMGILTSVPTNTTQTIQQSQLSCVDTAHFRANVPLMFRNV